MNKDDNGIDAGQGCVSAIQSCFQYVSVFPYVGKCKRVFLTNSDGNFAVSCEK